MLYGWKDCIVGSILCSSSGANRIPLHVCLVMYMYMAIKLSSTCNSSHLPNLLRSLFVVAIRAILGHVHVHVLVGGSFVELEEGRQLGVTLPLQGVLFIPFIEDVLPLGGS